MRGELRILPIIGMGEVDPGADLTTLILEALAAHNQSLEPADVLVVTQKIVSKAEGRIVNLNEIENPSAFAHTLAQQGNQNARYYELVLRESRSIVRMARGVLITETHNGQICANSGIDESNVAGGGVVTLLPQNPDQSARNLRAAIQARLGIDVAVIISDSFGRPWREGQINIAIGVSGLDPLQEYAGLSDPYGYTLRMSAIAIGDELASAAELVMGKVDRVPAAIVRGFAYTATESSAQRLLRNPAFDLFR